MNPRERGRLHVRHPGQLYQYLGNAFDSDSGFYDFHARAYSASVGRFTSKDPVEGFTSMPQSINPYAYGFNNPLAYPDPNGRCPICVAVGAYLLKNAAQSAAFSGGEYYLNHGADKGGVNWADFGRTVGTDTLIGSVNPFGGLGKASRILRVGDDFGGLLGRNARNLAREGASRVNTDLPGGRPVAKSIFRNQTKGQPITQDVTGQGTIIRYNPDRSTQIRMNPDGTTRVDLTGRGPRGRETIHFDE